MKIPNIIHFIFGCQEDFGGKPFSFVHYLAVRSAYEINKPDAMYFYYKHEPSGKWWQKSKKFLNLIKIDPPKSIFGNRLYHYAHQADVLRIKVLLKHGGIYLDMDTVCLKPFKQLFDYKFVMAREEKSGLCNAVMLSRPNSEFLNIWYEHYRSFRSKGRDRDIFSGEHSVYLPGVLAKENPHLIHVESGKSFFYPLHHSPEILWDNLNADFSKSFCIHLWEQVWWNKYLKGLTPKHIKNSNNNFAKLCKKFV